MGIKQAPPDVFRIGDVNRDRLARIAKERNLPKNQIARKAIEIYLDQLENENPPEV
ncbi:MAG: ribbon-helix-helix domain-containing protein [Plectolyngbya sp. WJT66-NPBG17]|jgi:predicted DNA-binding protein|nr:ribbon-helix-helix domain-containing protein [Plectolyngbya sp. WJT66-NPBG17]